MDGSESAPHPAPYRVRGRLFGHLLPASQGEGESRALLLCLLPTLQEREAIPAVSFSRLRGEGNRRPDEGPLFARTFHDAHASPRLQGEGGRRPDEGPLLARLLNPQRGPPAQGSPRPPKPG